MEWMEWNGMEWNGPGSAQHSVMEEHGLKMEMICNTEWKEWKEGMKKEGMELTVGMEQMGFNSRPRTKRMEGMEWTLEAVCFILIFRVFRWLAIATRAIAIPDRHLDQRPHLENTADPQHRLAIGGGRSDPA